jgi:hypothetical protein
MRKLDKFLKDLKSKGDAVRSFGRQLNAEVTELVGQLFSKELTPRRKRMIRRRVVMSEKFQFVREQFRETPEERKEVSDERRARRAKV